MGTRCRPCRKCLNGNTSTCACTRCWTGYGWFMPATSLSMRTPTAPFRMERCWAWAKKHVNAYHQNQIWRFPQIHVYRNFYRKWAWKRDRYMRGLVVKLEAWSTGSNQCCWSGPSLWHSCFPCFVAWGIQRQVCRRIMIFSYKHYDDSMFWLLRWQIAKLSQTCSEQDAHVVVWNNFLPIFKVGRITLHFHMNKHSNEAVLLSKWYLKTTGTIS